MKDVRVISRMSVLTFGIIAAFLFARPAKAELHIAGQVGGLFPGDVGNVDWLVGGASAPGSDLELDNSVLYGS